MTEVKAPTAMPGNCVKDLTAGVPLALPVGCEIGLDKLAHADAVLDNFARTVALLDKPAVVHLEPMSAESFVILISTLVFL